MLKFALSHYLKPVIIYCVISQMIFALPIPLQANSHKEAGPAASRQVNLAEEGRFFLPEFNGTDLRLMVGLASGDPFGLHQEYPDPRKNPYFEIDREFGPTLVTPAPNLKQFKDNISIEINREGHLIIKERDDRSKRGLGRQQIFKSWKFTSYHIANDYLFLEVDHRTLPKAYAGEAKSSLNQSVVVVRLNDLINYMGTRRIVMSLMPLPFAMEELKEIEYRALEEGKGKADLALSKALGRQFETGGYVFTDKSGKRAWIPDHMPDVYSDLSRQLIRGLSASTAPVPVLSEKLSPDVVNYMKALEAFTKRQNEKMGGALSALVDQFMAKGDPRAIKDLPFNTPVEFVRSTYRTELTAPNSGNWAKQAYGTQTVEAKLVDEAEKLVEKNAREVAPEVKEAESLVKQVQNPHPTNEQIEGARGKLHEISELAEQVKGMDRSAVKRFLSDRVKGGLGNIIGLLAIFGIVYSFYTYTSFGVWSDNIIEGTKAMFQPDVLWNALRVNAAIIFGYFGGILAALIAYNKMYNRVTGRERSFGMFLGSIGKKKMILTYLIPSKIIMNLIYPNYSKAIYMGAYPTAENGGRQRRFARSFRNLKSFYGHLKNNYSIPAEERNSVLLDFIGEEKEGRNAFSRLKVDKILWSTAYRNMKRDAQREKGAMEEKMAEDGRLNNLARERVLFEMLPTVARSLGMSEFELVNALSFSPDLFNEEKFVEPSKKLLEKLMQSGRSDELTRIYQDHLNRVERIKDRRSGLFLRYALHRENKRIKRALANSQDYLRMEADLKSVYYLAIEEVRERIFSEHADIGQEEVREIFERALERQEKVERTADTTEKAKLRQDLSRAIATHKKMYLDLRRFQQRGLRVRQYTALARIDEDNVKRIQRQVAKDYFMERVQSYAEFYKMLGEKGISFYASNMGEFFDANHTFGVYNQDARHALWNSWAWMISGPLGSANIVNRSARDAIDKGVEKHGFFYRNMRQFVNARRYRQMNIFNRAMWFEYVRGFTRSMRSALVFSTIIHLTFYHQIRPDVFVTSLLMYGPLLFSWEYIESKLMHATNAIRFDKEVEKERNIQQTLAKYGKSDVSELPYGVRTRLWLSNATMINPQNYYQIFGLFAFNALTFFFERWSYNEGGVVKLVTGGVANWFGNPSLAFSLQDVKEKLVEPHFWEIAAFSGLAFVAYKTWKHFKKKMEASRLMSAKQKGESVVERDLFTFEQKVRACSAVFAN